MNGVSGTTMNEEDQIPIYECCYSFTAKVVRKP